MKFLRLLSLLLMTIPLLTTEIASAQTTVQIGSGTSSSSSRGGPLQISGGSSTVVYSRFNMIYTAAEIAAAGIENGNSITAIKFYLNSTNIIQGAGNATLKVYIKNSSATVATADSWTNLISGSTLVADKTYNTTDNFPGVKGFMDFYFSSVFVYTGGAIEIAVDWDMSGITADPAGGVQAFNDPDAGSSAGAIKWRYTATGSKY